MKFHPASQIMTWCLLVVTIQALAFEALLAITCLVFFCALSISGHKFIQLLRRTRWIALSLLLIYAYSTPGISLVEALGAFGPSLEGIIDGVLQLTRLIAALAGLAILLDRLDRQQLFAGLYTLFAPLQWLGISRERLAVRLALTLHYAEDAMLHGTHTWQDTLRSLLDPPGVMEEKKMELPLSRFAFADVLLLGGSLLMLWAAMR